MRYLNTDGPRTDQRTDGQGRLLRTPSGKPGVQNEPYNHYDIKGVASEVYFLIMLRTYLPLH